MEAVLIISLVAIALLVWKVIELNESIESLEISIRYELKGVARLLAELQPKGPVEIPARLDDQTLKEVVPGLFKERSNFIDDTFDYMARENKRANDAKDEYMKALSTGMFWEWYPELTGDWEKDRLRWNQIYDDLLHLRKNSKEDTEYQGTENGGPAGLTKQQAEEILSNLSKRRKSKLK